MLKCENFEVVGWEHAIRGMRNPKNSWDKGDSDWCKDIHACHCCPCYDMEYDCCAYSPYYDIGPNDHDLMMKLRNAGTDHRKYSYQPILEYNRGAVSLYPWSVALLGEEKVKELQDIAIDILHKKQDARILRITANGGWSSMSYTLYLQEDTNA